MWLDTSTQTDMIHSYPRKHVLSSARAPWKGTLSHFLQQKGTPEGILPCFIQHKGIQEGTFVVFLRTWGHRGEITLPDTQGVSFKSSTAEISFNSSDSKSSRAFNLSRWSTRKPRDKQLHHFPSELQPTTLSRQGFKGTTLQKVRRLILLLLLLFLKQVQVAYKYRRWQNAPVQEEVSTACVL